MDLVVELLIDLVTFLALVAGGMLLHKVYTKLGIGSRAALSRFDLEDHPGR
jgi:hypothetical protein